MILPVVDERRDLTVTVALPAPTIPATEQPAAKRPTS